MSRIGKQPVTLPAGVSASISSDSITIKGSKGELTSPLFAGITATQEDNLLTLVCSNLEDKKTKSFFGLARALVASNVTGVSAGFEKKLELKGVGYRAQAQGRSLNLSLGFSHPVVYELPEGVSAVVEASIITVSGIDKQRVGQVAAEIRAYRPPEPYKGKGVRYVGEHVVMKEGKKA
ncbi:MAG: 50S ribosomal protein L6 [Zetaproteobacteria bacterium CG12_big_fil_rev_8_21_14_0_65_54_13]|nr:MAG: 50S ribosomal protein L6 [Zetaproteobacteria bacterium CG23_combo_of_CG06-09_8_20_14_all_54_7]PIW49122.1 MAG: 50S ribosomal protein L6 [Zetaproteobacteria bacterium CG12_big_fil_rev_8_21_14_0_65_54_13]PIX55909.1 MAG: 50S ribosomal protein L6 [Zetaproteobacteria bacterium CG_4_10_14_3_um_filter_54_28]PJA30505.1 MAG: 50S ribosomal protein L6 [Zetaproteobacteria bacterium CG_4_9_14_3_um_filter_54_145]